MSPEPDGWGRGQLPGAVASPWAHLSLSVAWETASEGGVPLSPPVSSLPLRCLCSARRIEQSLPATTLPTHFWGEIASDRDGLSRPLRLMLSLASELVGDAIFD